MKDRRPGSGHAEQEAMASPDLCDDQLYRALASTERRRLLYMLLVEDECTTGKIATVLSGWNATEHGKMATPDDREEILIELEHVHLPVLDETGLVSYDREDGTVSIEPLEETVKELIRLSVETETSP